MVCHLIKKLPQHQIEKNVEMLKINPYRAVFLLQCTGGGHGSPEQTTLAQIREAVRLGITFRSTAKMMRMLENDLSNYATRYSIIFPKKSNHKLPKGHFVHSLFID
jgi:hypothetical protein